MNIGTKIRKARKDAGFSQLQLADRVHVTPRSIQWYESGDRQPPSAVLYLIAAETGRTMDWFYSEDDDPMLAKGAK